MPINKSDLKMALSLFQIEDGQTQLSGKMNMVFSSITAEASKTKKSEMLYLERFIKYLTQDFWNIYTILHRLDWQRLLWQDDKLQDIIWITYAQTDINQFHVELKSAMDYIARIIRGLPPNPWQSPGSFNDLLNWIQKEYNKVKIDPQILKILQNSNWFIDIRDLRDLTVHEGGFSLVFGSKGKITFQTYKGWQEQVNIPEIMFNDNIVDFELYAGMYLGYLLALYENLSQEISRLIKFHYKPLGAYTIHFGLEYVRNLIQKVYAL